MTMKIFLSADIEGVAGVASRDQLMPGSFEWERARKWMTGEVRAAAEAAAKAGATDIIVADSHGNAQNILVDELPDYVRVVKSWPRPLLQMQGVEEDHVVACAFIGYHASSRGMGGALAHTYVGAAFYDIRINGVSASEAYANAALAGHYGVPLIFVSGDDGCVEEIRRQCPEVEAVVTKKAHGNLSVTTVTPARSQQLIADGMTSAMTRLASFRPLTLAGAIRLEIDFKSRESAEVLSYLPMIKRTSATTIQYDALNMEEVMRFLSFTIFYAPALAPPAR